jgi:hypothetical protein
MEPTATAPTHAPKSQHGAVQAAAWRQLWRILLRPLPSPAERPADPGPAADEAR